MLYIPVLKNRMYETKILIENQKLFNKGISPLIEVVHSKIGRKNVEFKDLIQYYDENLNYQFMIDIFAFEESEYKHIDFNQLEFSMANSKQTMEDYLSMLKIVAQSNNGVPVVSIKSIRHYFENSENIVEFITRLQKESNTIVVRIAAKEFHKHFKTLDRILRGSDVLLFDINETSIESYFIDVEDLIQRLGEYMVILLHSPRKEAITNKSYLDGDYTALIDNDLLLRHKDIGFDGIADYAGYKNTLPSSGGGYGTALALFFLYNKNKFFAIADLKSGTGPQGFKYVTDELLYKYKDLLDPNAECPAYQFIIYKKMSSDGYGNWGQWNYITMLRYISQIKNNL